MTTPTTSCPSPRVERASWPESAGRQVIADDGRRVVMRIAGGLGNQLFQYAMGRRLALRNQVPLVLDPASGFARDFYRRVYLLHHFNIRAELIDPSSTYVTFGGRIRRKLQIWLNARRPLEKRTYIVESSSDRFDPAIRDLRVTRSVYFEGYWQHEAYFEDIRDLLCEELTQRTPHDAVNVEVAERIRSVEAVCLHCRRLRNVPNIPDARPVPTSPEQHLDPSYYQRAAEELARRVASPHFFVFADYPDWAREHIRLPHPVEYITHNGADKDYEDFWLMTQCRHFIIANSTFSWWAAWLGQHRGKIVIAPQGGIGVGLQSVPPSWLLM